MTLNANIQSKLLLSLVFSICLFLVPINTFAQTKKCDTQPTKNHIYVYTQSDYQGECIDIIGTTDLQSIPTSVNPSIKLIETDYAVKIIYDTYRTTIFESNSKLGTYFVHNDKFNAKEIGGLIENNNSLKIQVVKKDSSANWKNTAGFTKSGIYLFFDADYIGPVYYYNQDTIKTLAGKKTDLDPNSIKNISSIKIIGNYQITLFDKKVEETDPKSEKFSNSTPNLPNFNDKAISILIENNSSNADGTNQTTPGGATDTGGTGSGNTGSGGYTGPGGVAGTKPGRKIPVPNLNYPLSAAPILPNVRNPGNLPFIHDPELSEMTDMSKYGTIKNETAYQAFGKAIEFAIKTLIKLVGVSSLFGITYGLVHYAIAHGETELQEKGTKMILWSIVGLILSLISHAIVTGLMQFLTGVGTINI